MFCLFFLNLGSYGFLLLCCESSFPFSFCLCVCAHGQVRERPRVSVIAFHLVWDSLLLCSRQACKPLVIFPVESWDFRPSCHQVQLLSGSVVLNWLPPTCTASLSPLAPSPQAGVLYTVRIYSSNLEFLFNLLSLWHFASSLESKLGTPPEADLLLVDFEVQRKPGILGGRKQ